MTRMVSPLACWELCLAPLHLILVFWRYSGGAWCYRRSLPSPDLAAPQSQSSSQPAPATHTSITSSPTTLPPARHHPSRPAPILGAGEGGVGWCVMWLGLGKGAWEPGAILSLGGKTPFCLGFRFTTDLNKEEKKQFKDIDESTHCLSATYKWRN